MPAQWTTPLTLRRKEGHVKQTRKVTSSLTIGHLTASFFIRATILPLTAPFSCAVTSLGTLAGVSTEKIGTSYLVGGTDKGYPDGQRGGRLYRVRSKLLRQAWAEIFLRKLA
jgi:hypothetical protein